MHTGLGALTTVLPVRAFANQHFARYNTTLTTKRAGTNRPFFLVERFWSSKLSGKSLRGLSGFLFFRIELNTWHCSKSLNKL